MELYENIENSTNNHKNINCKYKINKYKNCEEQIFIDKDILYNISLQDFNIFNKYIILNEIEEQSKEKKYFRFLHMQECSLKQCDNLDIENNHYRNMERNKSLYDNNSCINEYPRYIGKMEYYIERERNELIDIQKHDRDFDKIRLEEKTHKHQEEMKKLNNIFENVKVK